MSLLKGASECFSKKGKAGKIMTAMLMPLKKP
jgi:hypothetical protein